MKNYRRSGLLLAEMLLLILLDQGSKALAVDFLKAQPSFVVLPGVFELSYLENRGAAWGILENAQVLFLIITIIMLVMLALFLRKLPEGHHWQACRFFSAMLAAGAVGNSIDRLVHGYVIDFLYFSCIDFPVFNLADCYITVSIALFLLIYRKEVLQWARE